MGQYGARDSLRYYSGITASDRQKLNQGRMKERCFEYLGGKCVECGTTENLEFDHIDPSTKKFAIAWSLNRKWEYLLPELDKCQLLCVTHHAKKTSKQRSTAVHGTRSKYNGGCHCEECTAANTYYEWERRRRAKLKNSKGS